MQLLEALSLMRKLRLPSTACPALPMMVLVSVALVEYATRQLDFVNASEDMKEISARCLAHVQTWTGHAMEMALVTNILVPAIAICPMGTNYVLGPLHVMKRVVNASMVEAATQQASATVLTILT